MHSLTEWFRLEGPSGGHLAESTCTSRLTSSHFVHTASKQLLKTSKDKDSTTRGNLHQHPVTRTVRKCLLMFRREPPVFQSVPTSSCSVTRHHWEEPASIFFTVALQIFLCLDETCHEPSPDYTVPASSACPEMRVAVVHSSS